MTRSFEDIQRERIEGPATKLTVEDIAVARIDQIDSAEIDRICAERAGIIIASPADEVSQLALARRTLIEQDQQLQEGEI